MNMPLVHVSRVFHLFLISPIFIITEALNSFLSSSIPPKACSQAIFFSHLNLIKNVPSYSQLLSYYHILIFILMIMTNDLIETSSYLERQFVYFGCINVLLDLDMFGL